LIGYLPTQERSIQVNEIKKIERVFIRTLADLPVGSIFALKNKAALARANITHILSVLRLQPNEETFASYQHHRIEVDDVDDENLLEHFPSAVQFIQSGLDAGGSVLVHWSVKLSFSSRFPILDVCAFHH
jgi:dual specificity phosphatase 12